MSTLLAELRFAKPKLTPNEHTENRYRRQEEDGNQVNRQQLGEVVPRRHNSPWFQIVWGRKQHGMYSRIVSQRLNSGRRVLEDRLQRQSQY